MIEDADEQLNDESPDDEELEPVGKLTSKRAMSSKENQRKQREENQHKAEAELAAAQQAVADKTRLLEEARKSVVEADNQLKEQQNLQARGETEAQELQKAALEKQRFAAEAALAAAHGVRIVPISCSSFSARAFSAGSV